MNWHAIGAIVRKDLKVIRRSRGVMLPLIIVPALVCVLLPGLFAALPQMIGDFALADTQNDMDVWLAQLPSVFQQEFIHYTDPQRMIILLAVYYFAPMYLILPLMVSSVIAADSLAGEKERKTLEALLYTSALCSMRWCSTVWAGRSLGAFSFPTRCGGCWRCGWPRPWRASVLGSPC
jgi:ABC-type Na+ efflux pump permease subunit